MSTVRQRGGVGTQEGRLDVVEVTALAERLTAANEQLETAMATADDAWEALASEQRFLRQIIDLNPNFVFAKDRAGRFTLVNRAVADAYGTTAHALVGKVAPEYGGQPDEADAPKHADLEVLDSLETRYIAEERMTDAAGNVRWLQTVKRPIIGPDGRADQVLSVSTDITERKRLEAQLIQAQKMEAIGRLAGGVAHDFNNLLTVIMSYSALVLDELGPADRLRGDVVEIRRAADRATQLTKQLLAFSRKQVTLARVLDVDEVLTDLETMLHRLIGEDIHLVMRGTGESLLVKVDPGQLEQVIVNLVVNARDAMPEGGEIIIDTSLTTTSVVATVGVSGEAGCSRSPSATALEYVVITVSDSGTGMDAETMSHIFEPFFTTKSAHRGTGLGLATVYGIVRQSGGDIRVQSAPSRGTSMQVLLPRTRHPRAESSEAAQPALARGGDTGTILLVEDDAVLCALACRVLTASGYTVLEARDGQEALEVSSRYEGRIDLVATDVIMPRLSGGALVERLSTVRPDARVLFMSGYAEDEVVRRIVTRAGAPFLQKPFTPDTLCRRVREILENARAADAGAAAPEGIPPDSAMCRDTVDAAA